jgi:hypothetical protein
MITARIHVQTGTSPRIPIGDSKATAGTVIDAILKALDKLPDKTTDWTRMEIEITR